MKIVRTESFKKDYKQLPHPVQKILEKKDQALYGKPSASFFES